MIIKNLREEQVGKSLATAVTSYGFVPRGTQATDVDFAVIRTDECSRLLKS